MRDNSELHQEHPGQLPANLGYLTTLPDGFTDLFFVLDTEKRIQALTNTALDYSNNTHKKVIGFSCSVICKQPSNYCGESPITMQHNRG
jgi:hypothetical protein